MPYLVVNTLLDGGFPKGALNYWKSAFLTNLLAAIHCHRPYAYKHVPSPMSAIIIEHLHGQATLVAPTATAYPWRETGYSVLVIAQWADPADTQTNVAWAQDLMQQMRPHLSERRYMNYMSADDAGFVREAYGPNYGRLVESSASTTRRICSVSIRTSTRTRRSPRRLGRSGCTVLNIRQRYAARKQLAWVARTPD